MNSADAGDDPVGLAETLDEPGDDDDPAAVPIKEARGPVDTLGGEEDIPAVALEQRSAAEVPDREPDVIPEHGADEPE